MDKNNNEYYTIDLMHIVKFLWKRAWIIILAALLVAGIGFSFAAFFIAPTYSSSVVLYINNLQTQDKVNINDINASKELVKTCGEILDNSDTLKQIILRSGVKYDHEQLSKKIAWKSLNDTQVMQITVTTTDPEEAAKIANCIADVLPDRVQNIIDGGNMKPVSLATPDYQKVAPSISRYTVIGGVIGMVIAIAVLSIIAMLDDTIHDENYIIQSYKYPILAKIPDLTHNSQKHYGGYYYAEKQTENENK